METWGSGGIAPAFLTSALDGGEWSASRLGRFTPGERTVGNHWVGDWVSSEAAWTLLSAYKSCPWPDSNPESLVQPIVRRYTD
jgi:hypothetical protein